MEKEIENTGNFGIEEILAEYGEIFKAKEVATGEDKQQIYIEYSKDTGSRIFLTPYGIACIIIETGNSNKVLNEIDNDDKVLNFLIGLTQEYDDTLQKSYNLWFDDFDGTHYIVETSPYNNKEAEEELRTYLDRKITLED